MQEDDSVDPNIFNTAGFPIKDGNSLFDSSWAFFNSLVALIMSFVPDELKYKAFKIIADHVARMMGFPSLIHAILYTMTEYINKMFGSPVTKETMNNYYKYLYAVIDNVNWTLDTYLTVSNVIGFGRTNFLIGKTFGVVRDTAIAGSNAIKSSGFSMETAIQWGKQAATQIAGTIAENKDAFFQDITTMAQYQLSLDNALSMGLPLAAGIGFAYWAYNDYEDFYNYAKQAIDTMTQPLVYLYRLTEYPNVVQSEVGDKYEPTTFDIPDITEMSPEQRAVDDAMKAAQRHSNFQDFINKVKDAPGQPDPSLREFPKPQAQIPVFNPNMARIGQMPQVGLGVGGRKKGYLSKKSVPQRKDEFCMFGKHMINMGLLCDRNTVSLRSKGGWKLKNTPNKIVGGAVAGVLQSMVNNKQPNPDHVLQLTDDEKEYLNKLTASADVDGFNVPTKKKTEEEKLKHEFEKTRGIIAAGNDNPDLIKTFKRMLVQLIHSKQIPKTQAADVLMELHLLGH